MNILVIDIGGTHIKLGHSAHPGEKRKFDSGTDMTPQKMLENIKSLSEGWPYEAVSIGYPGAVLGGKPVHEPHNLAEGWVSFDFAGAFGCQLKLVNDAAMQVLGNYRAGFGIDRGRRDRTAGTGAFALQKGQDLRGLRRRARAGRPGQEKMAQVRR